MKKVQDFTCPKCGHNVLKTVSEPKRNEPFPDAACAKCGTAISEDEIRKQAGNILDKLVWDAIRKTMP